MDMFSSTSKNIVSRSKCQIITVCSTGAGGAKAIIDILDSKLTYSKDLFEIIPIRYINEFEVKKTIERFKKVVFVVSAFEFKCTKFLYTLDELIDGTCIESMQELINIETTYNNISESLKDSINNIDIQKATKDAKNFIDNTMNKLNIEIDSKYLIGIVFHIVAMLDRIVVDDISMTFKDKDKYIKENPLLYKVVQEECSVLNDLYSVSMPIDEVCYLMNLFNPKNFLNYKMS